jgi:hypothetical protein
MGQDKDVPESFVMMDEFSHDTTVPMWDPDHVFQKAMPREHRWSGLGFIA